MPSVSFTDGTGAATVQSSWPAPANRFASWLPWSSPIGEGAHELGTGMRHQFRFRTDYGAEFTMRGILNTDVDLVLRLQAHLMAGGTVQVTTDDSASRTYATCCLAPDGEVILEGPDPQTLEYAVRLRVINVAASPIPMLCEYP